MANELNTSVHSQKVSMAEEREHELPLLAKRIVEIPSNQQIRIEYDTDGTKKYVGYGARGLATSDDGWLLHKFTYDANKRMTLRQTAYDSWDNRATATYA